MAFGHFRFREERSKIFPHFVFFMSQAKGQLTEWNHYPHSGEPHLHAKSQSTLFFVIKIGATKNE